MPDPPPGGTGDPSSELNDARTEAAEWRDKYQAAVRNSQDSQTDGRATVEAQLESLRAANAALSADVKLEREELAEVREVLAQRDASLGQSAGAVARLGKEVKEREAKATSLRAHLAEAQEELRKARATLRDETEQRRSAESQVDDSAVAARNALRKEEDARRDLRTIRERLAAMEASMEEQSQALHREVDGGARRVEDLELERKNLRLQARSSEDRSHFLEEELTDRDAQLKAMLKDFTDANQKLRDANDHLEECQQVCDEQRDRADKVSARLAAAESETAKETEEAGSRAAGLETALASKTREAESQAGQAAKDLEAEQKRLEATKAELSDATQKILAAQDTITAMEEAGRAASHREEEAAVQVALTQEELVSTAVRLKESVRSGQDLADELKASEEVAAGLGELRKRLTEQEETSQAFSARCAELGSDLARTALLLATVRVETDSAEAKREALAKQLSDTSQKLEQDSAALEKTTAQREELSTRTTQLEQVNIELTNNLKVVVDEAQDLKVKLATAEEELQNAQPRVEEANKEGSEALSKFHSAKSALRAQVIRSEELRVQLGTAEGKNTQAVSALVAAVRQMRDMSRELTLLRDAFSKEGKAAVDFALQASARAAQDSQKIAMLENLKEEMGGTLQKTWTEGDAAAAERTRLGARADGLSRQVTSLQEANVKQVEDQERETAQHEAAHTAQVTSLQKANENQVERLEARAKEREELTRSNTRSQTLAEGAAVATENSELRRSIIEMEMVVQKAILAREEMEGVVSIHQVVGFAAFGAGAAIGEVRRGDFILEVDSVSVRGEPLHKVEAMLLGPMGSCAVLHCRRGAAPVSTSPQRATERKSTFGPTKDGGEGEEFSISLIRGWRNHSMALERTWHSHMSPEDVRDAALLDAATRVMRTVCAEEAALRRTRLLLVPVATASQMDPELLPAIIDRAIVQSKKVNTAFADWHRRHPPITNAETLAEVFQTFSATLSDAEPRNSSFGNGNGAVEQFPGATERWASQTLLHSQLDKHARDLEDVVLAFVALLPLPPQIAHA